MVDGLVLLMDQRLKTFDEKNMSEEMVPHFSQNKDPTFVFDSSVIVLPKRFMTLISAPFKKKLKSHLQRLFQERNLRSFEVAKVKCQCQNACHVMAASKEPPWVRIPGHGRQDRETA